MTVAKPQDFKLTRFYADSTEESIAIQEAMFKMGFRWTYTHSGTVRTVRPMPKCWLIVDDECRIYWTAGHMEFKVNGKDTKAASQEALFAAAEAFHKQKTQKRKESRMRKQGWIINTGVKPEGTVITVRFKGGDVRQYKDYTGDFSIPFAAKESYTVVAYRLKAEPKSETVTFEHMVQEIVKDSKINPDWCKGCDPDNCSGCPPIVEAAETNPVAAVGDVDSDAKGSGARYNAGKPDFSLIPLVTLEGEARVWAYGAKKYKEWNWMKGMNWSVPYASLMRHMAAWQSGEDTDPETGESHLDHAMCNLRMLRFYKDFYKEGDNRPKQFFNDDLV